MYTGKAQSRARLRISTRRAEARMINAPVVAGCGFCLAAGGEVGQSDSGSSARLSSAAQLLHVC